MPVAADGGCNNGGGGSCRREGGCYLPLPHDFTVTSAASDLGNYSGSQGQEKASICFVVRNGHLVGGTRLFGFDGLI